MKFKLFSIFGANLFFSLLVISGFGSTQLHGETPDLSKLKTGEASPGLYIVTYKQTAKAESLNESLQLHQIRSNQIGHRFSKVLTGFSARLSDLQVRALSGDPNVQSIEPDKVVRIRQSEIAESWGLDRIDQRALPLDQTYHYEYSGNGVSAYVIDTGIRYDHQEFGGRASFGFDAFGGDGKDCAGHGTHVAGTIGGATYGVAKSVRLVSVRVLDCSGSGLTSGVIAGIDWVTQHHATTSVANLSLGGGPSPALDSALQRMIAAGVTTAVAAGNENTNACNSSPSRVPEAITVGATNNADARAYFSNFGPCVDIFAPGVAIRSASNSGNDKSELMDGTSMASPHVAGVAALYLEHFSAAPPKEVRDVIVDNSSKDIVTQANSTNKHLLYSLLSGAGTPPGPTPTPSPTPPGGNTDTQPPQVSIVKPANKYPVVVGRTVEILAAASDNVGVTEVAFYVNNFRICESEINSLKCNWKVPNSPFKQFTIKVVAKDSAGNQGEAKTLVWSITQSRPVSPLK